MPWNLIEYRFRGPPSCLSWLLQEKLEFSDSWKTSLNEVMFISFKMNFDLCISILSSLPANFCYWLTCFTIIIAKMFPSTTEIVYKGFRFVLSINWFALAKIQKPQYDITIIAVVKKSVSVLCILSC